jgi:2-oxoacid dehydrogenases acyltransferase (catalytic domain)
MLWVADSVPSIPIRRRMHLSHLVAARNQLTDRPSWVALFAKAYGLVAREFPELRRAYVKLPLPQICEYPASVATVAVERTFNGEPSVFFARLNKPDVRPVSLMSGMIRDYKERPVEDVSEFRMQIGLGRYPGPLLRLILWYRMNRARHRGMYFGTFGITNVGALGSALLHPRGPVTTILSYGPVGEDGSVDVTIVFDHRVVDGATVARALRRLEEVQHRRLCRTQFA